MFPGNLLSSTAVVLVIIFHHSRALSMLTTPIILRRTALFIPCTSSVSVVAKSRTPKVLYPPLRWTREGPCATLSSTMTSASGAFSSMEDGAQGSHRARAVKRCSSDAVSRLRGDDTFSSQDNCQSQPRPDGATPPSSMLARVVPADEPWLTEAGERLRRGKLVAFPTETVYGLGANALSKEAVLKIFKAKQRPLTDPLIVHVPDQASALGVVDFDGEGGGGEKARRLLALLGEKLWPGPLTLILKAAGVVPSFVTAGTGFVGVRCPAHPVTRQLLSIAGVPVAAPSANRFGHVSPTRADHVMEDLGGSDIMILDGDAKGVCGVGIESTVAKIDVANDRIVVLRMGGVTQARLREVLAEGEEFATMGVHAGSVAGGKNVTMETEAEYQDQEEAETRLERDEAEGQAPGQLLRHYSPDLEVFRVLGGKTSTAAATGEVSGMRSIGEPAKFAEMARTSVVIDFAGQLKSLRPVALAYSDLSAEGNTREAAEGLFRALRWAEGQSTAQRLLIAGLPSESSGDLAAAINDRIYRAASGKSISLD